MHDTRSVISIDPSKVVSRSVGVPDTLNCFSSRTISLCESTVTVHADAAIPQTTAATGQRRALDLIAA